MLWTVFLEILAATQESKKNIKMRLTWIISITTQMTLWERLMPLLPLIWVILFLDQMII